MNDDDKLVNSHEFDESPPLTLDERAEIEAQVADEMVKNAAALAESR